MSRRLIQTECIVIDVHPLRESDFYLTLCTKEHGLLSARAYRARNPKSPLFSLAQPWNILKVDLQVNGTHYTLEGGQRVKSFNSIASDLTRQSCAAHISRLLRDLALDITQSETIYTLTVWALWHLSQSDSQPEHVLYITELRLLYITGFAPIPDPEDTEGERYWFSFGSCVWQSQPDLRAAEGGRDLSAYGSRFRDRQSIMDASGMWMDRAVLQCLHHIARAPYSRLFNFTASPDVYDQLKLFADRFASDCLERDYRYINPAEQIDYSDEIAAIKAARSEEEESTRP